MIRAGSVIVLTMLAMVSCAQQKVLKDEPAPGNSLLWKVEGNGLEKPSWIFGTIHMLCKDDAVLSDNMRQVIRDCDVVYMEMDLDNIFEMMGAFSKLKMTGDTTLRDLLSEKDYSKVKAYFEEKSTLLPFSVLETYKPMMASSLLSEGDLPCEGATSMEQIIM